MDSGAVFYGGYKKYTLFRIRSKRPWPAVHDLRESGGFSDIRQDPSVRELPHTLPRKGGSSRNPDLHRPDRSVHGRRLRS